MINELKTAIHSGSDWLARIQVTDANPVQDGEINHAYQQWRGAVRGECNTRTRGWSFFCPAWHTGQAVLAWVNATRLGLGEWTESARLGAQFLLDNQRDDGLILAYEDHPDKVNTSAILEGLSGLFALSDFTGDTQYETAALRAIDWVAERAYQEGQGIFLDLYDIKTEAFIPRGYLTPGRPLADDSIFFEAFRRTGQSRYLEIALAVCDRLLRDEKPAGNWIDYPPCLPHLDSIHPRQAFWWGRPFLTAYKLTDESRYLAAFKRSVNWYQRALRKDGGIFRDTSESLNSNSFAHTTSASACAALMFMDLWRESEDESVLPVLKRALKFCLSMQIRESADDQLRGAVIEGVLSPNGTDQAPLFIRDLATIFFIQAACSYLEIFEEPRLNG